MKPQKRMTNAICLLLALAVTSAALLSGCGDTVNAQAAVTPVPAAPEEAQPQVIDRPTGNKKSETVYVNLDATGKPYGITVSDWLHSDRTDALFSDRSDLRNIETIKGEGVPKKTADGLDWQMEGNDLYYEGESDKPLPLSVEITYALDGVEGAPQALAGKSGKLELRLRFKNEAAHTAAVAGKATTLYTPLVVSAAMSLSSEVFHNVTVSDGTILSDGNNQAVALVCLPGLRESLGLGGYSVKELNDLEFPEEFIVTADVTGFEMGPIMVAATTQLPDLEQLKKSDDFESMKQDLYALRDLQRDLGTKLDPDRDIRSLLTDPERTREAQVIVDDLFDFYDLNKDILDVLPKYVTDENIRLYDRIRYDLKDSTVDTLLDDDKLERITDLADDLQVARLNELVEDYQGVSKDQTMHALAKEFEAYLFSPDGKAMLSAGVDAAQKLAAHPQEAAALGKLLAARKELSALLEQFETMQPALLQELALTSARAMLMPDADGNVRFSPQVYGALTQKAGIPEAVLQLLTGAGNRLPPEADELPTEELPTEEPPIVEAPTVEPPTEEPPTVEPPTEEPPTVGPPTAEPSEPALEIQTEGEEDTVGNTLPPQEAADEADTAPALSGNEKDAARAQVYGAMEGLVGQSSDFALLLIAEQNPKTASLLKELKTQLSALGFADGDSLAAVLLFGGDLAEPMLKAAESSRLQGLLKLLAESPEAAEKLLGKVLPEALKHLEENDANMVTLLLLMEELQDANLLKQVKNLDDLRDDLRDLKPLVKSLRRDLDRTDRKVSLHESPHTVNTFMRMKDDLEQYRNISETLRNLLQPQKVELSRNMLATLDRLEAKGAADDAVEKLDDLDELLERKDLFVKLSEEYSIFTQAPAGVDTDVKFVLKTDEVARPEPVEAAAPAEEKGGFVDWIKELAGLKK